MKNTIIKEKKDFGLLEFLDNWDLQYRHEINDIDLFKSKIVKNWNIEQKKLFVRLFYHLRGHFDSFLWYMGNFAPNFKMKEMILSNIRDEFGKNGLSHEALYFEFAKSFDVDLTNELLDETYYLPFIKAYIKGQLQWLRLHDWNHRLAAFAAIERLDNVDYLNLRSVAENMGASKLSLTFFNVHINADHFDAILVAAFRDLWVSDAALVKNVFGFIKQFQLGMWKTLSETVSNYGHSK